MAKGKAYELAIKIAGRVDSSLKKACLDADENLGQLAKTAEKIGKAAKVAAGVTAAAATAVGVAAVKSYTEHEQAVNSMAAATGAAGEELDNLQGAMEAVYKNNFGENLQDAADAVATVDRNLKNITHGCRDGMKRARRKMRYFRKQVDAGEKTVEQVAEWLKGPIAYYEQFNDHGRVLKLRRLYYALFIKGRKTEEVKPCIGS